MKSARNFTPEEANATLPLVRQIVGDILATGREVRALSGAKPADQEEICLRIRKLERLVDELEQLGCFFKDWNFEQGLVDFPAIIDGQEVYLCWRNDEPEINHYHGRNEGYAGRKALRAVKECPSP